MYSSDHLRVYLLALIKNQLIDLINIYNTICLDRTRATEESALAIIGRGGGFVQVHERDFYDLLFPMFIELSQERIPNKNFRLEL